MTAFRPSSQELMKGGIQGRIRLLSLIVGAIFLVLLFQAWYLQIIQGAYYKRLSENNRIRVVSIPPHRGLIYDRHGEVIARNVPSFSVGLVVEDVPDLQETLAKMAPLLGMTVEEENQRVQNMRHALPYTPWILKDRLTFEEVARIKGMQWDLPGVVVEVETLRDYPFGSQAAHLLGYVGEISSSQLETPEYAGESPGRIVGQYGVEKTYDRYLRGKPGRKEIEVDAMGRERRTLRVEAPAPGKGLTLSLDLQVQKAAEEALGDRAGVVVAMDPRTGEILALASHPAFDPNLLSGRLSREVWGKIVSNPDYPLTNRAIQGQFPPGSIFKIVMAIGGLEGGFTDPGRKIECTGGYPMGRRVFKDWKKEGHGSVALHRAIVESCDVYFYQLGARMGVDTIARYATGLGLGQPTGIDLPSEKSGMVPTSLWKTKARGERWYPGETLSVAIGQGYLLVTPLQQAVLMGAVAHPGVRYRPHVALGILDKGKRQDFQRVEAGRLSIPPAIRDEVLRALRGVVEEPGGTGAAARSSVTPIGGKTGTAQAAGRTLSMGKEAEIPFRYRDHAWFTAFAPVEDPRLVVAVLVEHGGHGGSVAAPVAKKVIEAYLQ
jgi:penicillin-binding protein 2